MSNKILFEPSCPVTQTVEAVEALAKYLNKSIEAGVLDLGDVKLVLSNKKDVFYTTTTRACSCPSTGWHPGQRCKHQRKYFPQQKSQAARDAEVEGELAKERGPKRLARPPVDSIRPEGKWPGGFNGPVNMPEDRPKTILEEMKEQGYEMSFEADW